tara:strand:- start:527 stop:739 length:213 start_codon:yes stop_codon:yes gene_type:complete
MKNTPHIRVSINYEWEFDLSSWTDLKECNTQHELNKLQDKVRWDAISSFHHLNDIAYPTATIEVRKVKLG